MKHVALAALIALSPVAAHAQEQEQFANRPDAPAAVGMNDFALISQMVNGRHVTGKVTLSRLFAASGFQVTMASIAAALGYTPLGPLTGDVTTAGSSSVATIATGAVSAAKMASGAAAGNLGFVGGYPGISCAAGTVNATTIVVTNGIVTHC